MIAILLIERGGTQDSGMDERVLEKRQLKTREKDQTCSVGGGILGAFPHPSVACPGEASKRPTPHEVFSQTTELRQELLDIRVQHISYTSALRTPNHPITIYHK